MDIDWTTVAFQIVNFLVLLFILKKVLYGRIIAAMDMREAGIAAKIREAEQNKTQAEQRAADLAQKSRELDATRDDLIAQAKADAEATRKDLIGKARAEVDQTREQWAEAVAREKDGFLQDLRQRAAQQTCTMARRALADLAGQDLDGRVVEAFLARLEGLDEAERAKFASAVAGMDEGERHVLCRSAFELPDEPRQRVAAAVGSRLAQGAEVRFDTSAELICGIELVAGGTKLAWSIEDYLGTLEERLAEAFEAGEERAAQEAKAAAEKEQAKAPADKEEAEQPQAQAPAEKEEAEQAEPKAESAPAEPAPTPPQADTGAEPQPPPPQPETDAPTQDSAGDAS